MATPVERAREAAKRWGPSDSPMSRASRTAKMPVTITEAEYKWQTQQMDRQRQQTRSEERRVGKECRYRGGTREIKTKVMKRSHMTSKAGVEESRDIAAI